jgi:hypothetical protein
MQNEMLNAQCSMEHESNPLFKLHTFGVPAAACPERSEGSAACPGEFTTRDLLLLRLANILPWTGYFF